MVRKFKCFFRDEWDCPIQAAEVPLEVCRLCLNAKKLSLDAKKLSLDAKNSYLSVIRRTERAEVHELKVGDREGVLETLLSVDRLFIEGKISLDEYMRRREGLTRALEGTPAGQK